VIRVRIDHGSPKSAIPPGIMRPASHPPTTGRFMQMTQLCAAYGLAALSVPGAQIGGNARVTETSADHAM